MPEDQGTQQQGLNGSENPLQQINYSNDPLKDIDISLKAMLNMMQNRPASFGMGVRAPTESQSSYADSKWKFNREERHSKPRRNSTGSILGDFEEGIKQQLLDSLAGGDFKKSMQNALDTFAKEFGMDIRDLPNELGSQLTKQIMDSEFGKQVKEKANSFLNDAIDSIFSDEGGESIGGGLKNVVNSFFNSGTGGAEGSSFLSNLMGSAGGEAGSVVAEGAVSGVAEAGVAEAGMASVGTAGAGAAGAGAAGEAMAVGSMGGPWGIVIVAAILVALEILGPALEGLAEIAEAVGKSWSRDEDVRKQRAENARKRMEADMEWMAKKPFEILEEAAQEWYDAWDSNLRTIGQTQGYDKESVYALYEGYAERLREDSLDSIINATDIVDKLSSVLESGLSGQAAEEFAYIATKLNAAIPTQDFFGYAETYASIAANSIAQGKSQSAALADANSELEQFASNLLYSSRELAGGFSTGLKNSANLFQQATQIAQTARTYNASDISGTLTSVSAIIGAVAPDLADSLVSNVVDAAIGGNSDTIVALRSLAGINAGNTEFLRAMAENPQSIFSALFTNLANLQNMSPDNYMEVAEGLADVFGIDRAAFARVDFNYLAQAIDSMEVNNRSLQDNLDLLVSGQTTTSAEQLKAQEINKVILEEGLAYVIDSEAGRMIQEHMWEEQRTNAIMENEYSVSLQGAALDFLEGIRETLTTLYNFLNPIGFINKGLANMTQSIVEAIGNEQDIYETLMATAVGSNATSLYNLTTRGKDLELVSSYIEMLGGTKGVAFLNEYSKYYRSVGQVLAGGVTADVYNTIGNDITTKFYKSKMAELLAGSEDVSLSTRYNWGSVGKSLAKAVQDTAMNPNVIGKVANTIGTSVSSATQKAQQASNEKLQAFFDSAKEASTSMDFDTWLATAKEYGISNFDEALETYGRSIEEVKSYFEENRAQAGAREEVARKQDEEDFRNETRNFWDYSSGTSGIFQTAMWLPFFGDNQKYDTRMDAVDSALSEIQSRIGTAESYTVISGITALNQKIGEGTSYTVIGLLSTISTDIANTFVTNTSKFQQCLSDWTRYIAESRSYTTSISKSSAWSDLQNAERDQQTDATLALANALGVFSAEELQKLDPQLQTNVLLGEILVVLQTIMQQNNTEAGGLTLMDTMSALGLGMTFKTTT